MKHGCRNLVDDTKCLPSDGRTKCGAIFAQGLFGGSFSREGETVTQVEVLVTNGTNGVETIHLKWLVGLEAMWAAEVCCVVIAIHTYPNEQTSIAYVFAFKFRLGNSDGLETIVYNKMWIFACDIECKIDRDRGHGTMIIGVVT